MNIDELFEFDEQDPRDRMAEYILSNDDKLISDLVAMRKSQSLTQQDVADRMGINKSGVSRIESGGRDLLFSTLRRYLMAIDAVTTHTVHTFVAYDGTQRARKYFGSEGTAYSTSACPADRAPEVMRSSPVAGGIHTYA